MVRETQEEWRRADDEVRKNLPPGVKFMRTLRGHTRPIGRIAWSPDGHLLASPSEDRTIRLWDAETGECVHVLRGHTAFVNAVAFDPSGSRLASVSQDRTIRLWDATSGGSIRCLRGHGSWVDGVAFDPTGRTVATASGDCTVRLWDLVSNCSVEVVNGQQYIGNSIAFHPSGGILASVGGQDTVNLWDVASGRCVRSFTGHRQVVYGVSFDHSGCMMATASADHTVRLWDATTGRLHRSLEAHTDEVTCVAWDADGCLIATKSKDSSIRLWRCDDWMCVGVILEPASSPYYWPPGLTFHPHLPLLATVGSDPGTSRERCDCLVHIWELDLGILLGQPAVPTVAHTSAKVVLVGESNVGKSYLAHRIATGSPPTDGTIKSTHGMRFWSLEPEALCPAAKGPEGERRELVLWDMGGQEEYRLIHQLFLHDTTVALVLFDPTRGAAAFREVETWNKYIDKQLRGRAAVKLLVGAKMDEPSDLIDRQGLERLCRECGFSGYYESSALTGRGLPDLCNAIAKAIDWDGLGQTSRPELFQAIRDVIEFQRRKGTVVILFDDLDLGPLIDEDSPVFQLMETEVAIASDADAGTEALDAVCRQLSQQGIIADARTGSGKRVLVLRVEEIERYAGSLILAARNNPRGVPALELRAMAQADFALPGIANEERLPRVQEKAVLDCTVQLMLEHGICFQHEGLLVFPTLFSGAPAVVDAELPHAVSLYYDFAGAIDNIYASLVAWLVLARDFGQVRLWSNRAEFEIKDGGGLCGLHKVGRPGGFAHVDVYFESETPGRQRKQFISFVEDHLARNGVEIREHVAIKCACGHEFAEETLRQRIARGDKDVVCPVCETRHSLTQGAAEAREQDPSITQHTWALRTQIEKLREKITRQVVQVLAKAEEAKPATGPIRLLHLSDLHFTGGTPVKARLQWLLDDLKLDSGLDFKELDYLVISGDFTNRGSVEGFEKAYEFVSGLTREFGLSAERCVFVPGNHDVVDIQEAYEWRKKADGLVNGTWVKQGEIILVRSEAKYPLRFKPFSEGFFHKFLQRPYPLDYTEQGMAVPFWETGIQFLALNSCWQIDEFYRKRSGLHVEALAHAIKEAQKQEDEARKSGQLVPDKTLLRIAVCHHAVAGLEQMKDVELLGHLQRNNVKMTLHGDVHEMRCELIGYQHEKVLHVAGSGSFGARAEDLAQATPRLYNVLEIARDLKSIRVHTRKQQKPDGPWDGWYEWPDPDGGRGRVPYYDIKL